MIQSRLEGVEFLVANTDAQALSHSSAERKIQLGLTVTQGLGAGSRPEVGGAAAEEAMDQILEHMQSSHMVFITAGMGGGTGTGAGPVIARAAREMGMLTVGVVTRPFHFEGAKRMRIAEQGIEELTQFVDTLIIIPNQNLFRVANEKTTFADAFKMADDVLHAGVRGVTDLMVMPGLINLDFADIRTVMSEMGKAMMGTGESEGEKRATDAAEAAISNPLLEDISMKGARGVLINITGGLDMTLFEVDEAANRIRDEVDPEANIIFGSTFDESLEGQMRVSVVATGIDAEQAASPRPSPLSLVSDRGGSAAKHVHEAPARAAATAALRNPELDREGEGRTAMETPPEPPTARDLDRGVDRKPPAPAINTGATRATGVGRPAAAGAAELNSPVPRAQVNLPPLATPMEPPEASRPAAPSDAPFIAPPPAMPVNRQTEGGKTVDPIAEADLANGDGAQIKPKRLGASLFARVTGAGRNKSPESVPPPAPSKTERDRVAEPAQPKLGGLDPADRIKTSQSEEEDLLEIPAFLRRQAN
jgi:cell division protein FtsZ